MRYFFSIAGTVVNGRPNYIIGPLVSERDIIETAEQECERSGGSLAALAGIEFIKLSAIGTEEERWIPARDFFAGEELAAALMKLNQGPNVFEVFDSSSSAEIRRFISAAEALGHGFEARLTVKATSEAHWLGDLDA